jgi:hypothetical protein
VTIIPPLSGGGEDPKGSRKTPPIPPSEAAADPRLEAERHTG